MAKISKTNEHGTIRNEELSVHFMTSAEVAQYLKKSPGAVRNLVLRKKVTAYKVNRRLLFKKSEIDRWLEKSRVGNFYGY